MSDAAEVSPLDARHRELGAKFAPFGGWTMPLSYPDGTLAEHRACRSSVAAFDVSHLGTVRVRGGAALDRLQRAFTNDLNKIGPGRAQYTHLLDESGSVLDDIIVWWVDEDTFDVMPNASNTERVRRALGGDDADVEIEDVTHTRAVVAVQGPDALERLSTVLPAAAGVGRFRVCSVTERVGAVDVEMTVAGTGYTGERGVEMSVPAEHAAAVWDLVLAAGAVPAGLAARDTLRLEAALPLHGAELGPGITPLNAGLGWVIAWDKGDFPGRAALERQRGDGVVPVLVGLRTNGRRPPRSHQSVVRDGEPVGEVTSGNFSPVLGVGIALAYVDPAVEVGDSVGIDQRGTEVSAEVVDLPFV